AHAAEVVLVRVGDAGVLPLPEIADHVVDAGVAALAGGGRAGRQGGVDHVERAHALVAVVAVAVGEELGAGASTGGMPLRQVCVGVAVVRGRAAPDLPAQPLAGPFAVGERVAPVDPV